jgi:hypothetical protein
LVPEAEPNASCPLTMVEEVISRMRFQGGDLTELDKILSEAPKEKLIEEMQRRMAH